MVTRGEKYLFIEMGGRMGWSVLSMCDIRLQEHKKRDGTLCPLRASVDLMGPNGVP